MGDDRIGGVGDIAAERRRQIEQEGWTPEHDDSHADGELLFAAVAYVLYARGNGDAVREWWPWDPTGFKGGDTRRLLVKAGALIAAEIDRLDRRQAAPRRGIAERRVVVFGYSDDLVEVEGDLTEEWTASTSRPNLVRFSDGLALAVRYDEEGRWRASIDRNGVATAVEIVACPRGEDDPDDRNYSDRVTVIGRFDWVACNDETSHWRHR